MPGETLEQVCFFGSHPEMQQLHLGLGPGQGGGATEAAGIMVFIQKVQHAGARGRHFRPERQAHGCARRDPHAVTQRKHGIENRADRIRQRPSIHHGDRIVDLMPAAQKARAVGLELQRLQHFALNDRVMRHPDLGIAVLTTAPSGEQRTHFWQIFGLHK